MAALAIFGLHKHFGNVHVLRGVDLEAADREFTVLVGPSGCGKSTLLRTIAGVEVPDEGSISIGERVVDDDPPHRRDIAMVFQNYALYPYMTVFENIAFGLRARKVPAAEVDAKVRQTARMLAIADLLQRHPRQLSGGQLQRVAIGRAIVRDARLYLFDEPMSNLDAQLREEMRSEFKRLQLQLGKTMVYVTHDQVEAMTLADRMVLMKDGTIEQQGAPLDLYERPATRFVARFLGSPPIRFLEGTVVPDGDGLSVRLVDGALLPLPASRTKAVRSRSDLPVQLGLRPEHIGMAVPPGIRHGTASRRVLVDLVLPTGTRTYVTFALGDAEVMAELGAHDVARRGECIEVGIDMNRALLIDPLTERAIY